MKRAYAYEKINFTSNKEEDMNKTILESRDKIVKQLVSKLTSLQSQPTYVIRIKKDSKDDKCFNDYSAMNQTDECHNIFGNYLKQKIINKAINADVLHKSLKIPYKYEAEKSTPLSAQLLKISKQDGKYFEYNMRYYIIPKPEFNNNLVCANGEKCEPPTLRLNSDNMEAKKLVSFKMPGQYPPIFNEQEKQNSIKITAKPVIAENKKYDPYYLPEAETNGKPLENSSSCPCLYELNRECLRFYSKEILIMELIVGSRAAANPANREIIV